MPEKPWRSIKCAHYIEGERKWPVCDVTKDLKYYKGTNGNI